MDTTPLPPPPPLPAAPPPPAAESAAPSSTAVPPPSLLPYVVAVVSVAVLGAVAWLLFAQPRRARMAIDEVIVLDGPAPASAAMAAPPATEQSSSTAIDSSRQPSPPPAAAPAAATPVATASAAPAAEPAPGDVLEAELTGEGSSGDGFVQIGGITVYVAGGRKGERVRFRIREVKTSRKGNRYAQAERCAPVDSPAEGDVP